MPDPTPLDGFATSPEWNLYEGGIAVWPVGAFEQHGRHLPLMTDNLLATHFGRRLAADLDAVLLPTLPFGTSLEQAGFRGSITLTPELLMALVRQMADELEAQNFTRLVILSGHGGNFSLYPAARAINRADRAIKILVIGVGDVLGRGTTEGGIDLHAGQRETSIMLAVHPELVGDDRVPAEPDLSHGFRQPDLNTHGFGYMAPEGAWGHPERANAEEGAVWVEKLATALREFALTSLARLAKDPRYAGPGRVSLRPLRPDDLALGMRLKAAAGWNQLAADWQLLLSRGGAGNVVAMHNGLAVGTATTVDYGPFCWIGMVLVDPAARRRGVGTALLQGALDAAPSLARLDATPEGKTLYDTLGFHDEYRLARLECAAVPTIEIAANTTIRPATAADLEAIAALDEPVFGADRGFLLAHLLHESPAFAWVATAADGAVTGYCLGRPGSRFAQVGPVVAGDATTAIALASRALSAVTGQPAILDVPDAQSDFRDWLATLGFRVQRPFIRMMRGDVVSIGDPRRQFAIAGPELG
jgi:creatinine amidohydrolase/Fe(II)-dependent formamide hydrolase-like protein/GNAT superfamily N-acetyltransferase